MWTEDDAEKHRGLQYSYIAFDEITQFSQSQVTFMLTCLRSEALMDSFAIGTCNPDPDNWVYESLLKWYVDQDTGLPDPERQGVVRYFIILDGEFVFGDDEEYFKKNYPDSVYIDIPGQLEKEYIPPKTFTFIQLSVFDNPILLKHNPRYLSELKNLPEHEMQRQLLGNWLARPEGANYWKRDWLHKAETLPTEGNMCRGWDKAATEVSEVNRTPDFTASIGMLKDRMGEYYIFGNYHANNGEDENIKGRFRKRAGSRDLIISQQAAYDGVECSVVLPIDPGSHGKVEYQESAKKLITEGFRVSSDPTPTNKSKLTKFLPFASACENGLVHIVESTFPDRKTLEAFYKELEAFTGRGLQGFSTMTGWIAVVHHLPSLHNPEW